MKWLRRLLGGRDGSAKEKEIYFAPPSSDMDDASRRARETFRYFWREMAWESRRIVKGCEVACFKAPFADDGDLRGSKVEHMWIGDVTFDGREIQGVLINAPNWLRSMKAGDPVRMPLSQISDWMYALRGRAYGGFTVNAMRASMAPRDRKQHDEAWGLDFGDPASIQLVPTGEGWNGADGEHPMSTNMARSLAEHVGKNPGFVRTVDERGWTPLHDLALAGSLATVTVLVANGADVDAKTRDGRTAAMLAHTLGWTAVVDHLVAHGSTTP